MSKEMVVLSKLTEEECRSIGIKSLGFKVEKIDDYPLFDTQQNTLRVILGYVAGSGENLSKIKSKYIHSSPRSKYLGGLYHICISNNWNIDDVFSQIHLNNIPDHILEEYHQLAWIKYRNPEVNRLAVFDNKVIQLCQQTGILNMPGCFSTPFEVNYYYTYLAAAVGKMIIESHEISSEKEDLWIDLNYLHSENAQFTLYQKFLDKIKNINLASKRLAREVASFENSLAEASSNLSEKQYKELVKILDDKISRSKNSNTTAQTWTEEYSTELLAS